LTKHRTIDRECWALDGHYLPSGINLITLLELEREAMMKSLIAWPKGEAADGEVLAPIESTQEVWAAGVTYLRSRDARRAESTVANIYDHVYEAARPELFFKAAGWRVVGHSMPIRVRSDSRWNVPEPELVVVINRHGEIVGYCAGNDVSSRHIEGENPLYLPQAKVYNGSCALGHGIYLCSPEQMRDVPIRLKIQRTGENLFEGETSTATMKRTLSELANYLTMELDFPQGVFLMTGTCLVPGNDFTLQPGDLVLIQVGPLVLENEVASISF
jgi:2-dehydro-3-deoxy-D-arabinonate dehydratase